MEKILVLSDIHSGVTRAKEAVKMHPECKTVIFLGDGARHLDILQNLTPDAAFVAVRGNCDTFLDGVSETELVLDMGNHRIFICHGHTRAVKSGSKQVALNSINGSFNTNRSVSTTTTTCR